MASDPVDTLGQQNGGGMTACIQKRLDGVPPLYSECCIYRVPVGLRKINEEAYTPLFVSIGPFHHGKESLKVQETLKWQHLRSFVRRNPWVTLSQYVETIKEKEERIRKCYAEIISVKSNEFVTMMVVDGCFILEYIHGFLYPASSTNPWFYAIRRDLIILENQLPFFVLEDLYKLNTGGELAPIIRKISYSLFAFLSGDCSSSHGLPRDNINADIPGETSEKMHLLDFVRDNFIPSSSPANTSSSENKKLQLPKNVTALHKEGVKFKVGEARKRLLDVSFEKGELAIPFITIEDSTETLLRNMIAFEQLYRVGGRRYITDYATLMDNLIDTSKDVEMLQDKGIIKNSLGNHEEVSLLFNKLVKEVVVYEGQNFHFYDLCQKLNAYRRVWHAWMADLRQTYFNTPWTAISVIAAAVLIVLTFLQTIYTIESYIKQYSISVALIN